VGDTPGPEGESANAPPDSSTIHRLLLGTVGIHYNLLLDVLLLCLFCLTLAIFGLEHSPATQGDANLKDQPEGMRE